MFTLDGKNIIEYSEPFSIKDATERENVISIRKDISRGYDAGEYEIPQFNVDKCAVVKACVKYDDGTYSPVQARTYFVGLKGKDSVEGIGIVSLSMNPDYLFDYENGIYVLGKYYDIDPSYVYWWWANGNFRQKGKAWERKAFIQFFNKDGNLQLSQPCGVRIKGGGSRGHAQKSFNLYARKDYDGYNKFKYDFFGTGYKAKKLQLFTGGDDCVSKSLDYVAHTACNDESCEDAEFSTFHFKPYALFLNGEYWGMYWLTESYDDKYLEYTYKVDSDDVIMIKSGSVEEGNDDDIQLWNETYSFISQNDMTDSQNYEKAQELIDLESYVKYHAAQIYIGRYNDWPGGNTEFWRTRAQGSGYSDGRWRWMLFDVNSGSMEQYVNDYGVYYFDGIKYVASRDLAFASLLKNEDFKGRLKTELLYNSTDRFATQKMERIIDSFSASYCKNVEESLARWYGRSSNYYSNLSVSFDKRKNFFRNRAQSISECIEENLVIGE